MGLWVYIFASIRACQGTAMFGSLFTNEEQKNRACDVMYAVATHARHVYDVTALVKMQRSLPCFHELQTSSFFKKDHKID